MHLHIHVLHPVAPSLLNRGDNNVPKTIKVGGVERSRVSSQAWKRATRLQLNASLREAETALRTRSYPPVIAQRLMSDYQWMEAEAHAAAEAIHFTLTNGAPKGMLFLRGDIVDYGVMVARELKDRLLEVAMPPELPKKSSKAEKEAHEAAKKKAKLVASELRKEFIIKACMDSSDNIDIALHARFAASNSNWTVDGAVLVADAFSINPYQPVIDDFTAVDDILGSSTDDDVDEESNKPKVGMMGGRPRVSPVLYRHASVDYGQLCKNLPNMEKASIVDIMVRWAECFTTSFPSANKTSTAVTTYPATVIMHASPDPQGSLAMRSFAKPVTPYDGEDPDPVVAGSSRLINAQREVFQQWGMGGVARVLAPGSVVVPDEEKIRRHVSFHEVASVIRKDLLTLVSED